MFAGLLKIDLTTLFGRGVGAGPLAFVIKLHPAMASDPAQPGADADDLHHKGLVALRLMLEIIGCVPGDACGALTAVVGDQQVCIPCPGYQR